MLQHSVYKTLSANSSPRDFFSTTATSSTPSSSMQYSSSKTYLPNDSKFMKDEFDFILAEPQAAEEKRTPSPVKTFNALGLLNHEEDPRRVIPTVAPISKIPRLSIRYGRIYSQEDTPPNSEEGADARTLLDDQRRPRHNHSDAQNFFEIQQQGLWTGQSSSGKVLHILTPSEGADAVQIGLSKLYRTQVQVFYVTFNCKPSAPRSEVAKDAVLRKGASSSGFKKRGVTFDSPLRRSHEG
ncbi:hypothetical protein FRC17_008843 [Serendipita sp. 399]|nr:hypothetical protein FRC17_008843 [Serendipita sp. 399]